MLEVLDFIVIIITDMKITLSPEEKKALEIKHSQEKDHRKADRIKSILLRADGWSLSKISQALRLHNDTVSRYIADYLNNDNLTFNYQGSKASLNEEQSSQLVKHLEENLYTKVVEIVAYVKLTFDIIYTVSGMTDWLKKHDFSYKSPKGEPSKADIEKQKEFIEVYGQLKEVSDKNDEPILFVDGVHPSMQTKLSHGWIKKGKEKEVPTTASRTGINILGAINLKDTRVINEDCGKSINSQSILGFFDSIKEEYSDKNVIHLILDQASYNKVFEVREYAYQLGIHLHYLPPYSPNLNSIERLWKVMNETVRNNVFFETAKKFKMSVKQFFDVELSKLLPKLRSTINDKFHIKKPQTNSRMVYAQDSKYVFIQPGASIKSRRWKPTYFKSVVKWLTENGFYCIFAGNKHEQALIDEITANTQSTFILKTGPNNTLLQLAAIIDLCQFVITNDTGPMHIAEAMNKPIFSFFCTQDIIPSKPITTNFLKVYSCNKTQNYISSPKPEVVINDIKNLGKV